MWPKSNMQSADLTDSTISNLKSLEFSSTVFLIEAELLLKQKLSYNVQLNLRGQRDKYLESR